MPFKARHHRQKVEPLVAVTRSTPSIMSYRILFLLLLLSTTVFRLNYIGHFHLHPDEAYYWTWSQHPDWSYYDQVPMVAYLIWLFTRLGGNTEFFVRLPSVIFAFLETILIYQFSRRVFGTEEVGFLSTLLITATPIFLAGPIIMTPDSPFVFFWTLSWYLAYEIFCPEKNKGFTKSRKTLPAAGRFWVTNLWYLLGLSLGLGLLSKYTMVLFIPSIFLFLLLSDRNRFWIRRKEPYVSLLLSILIFSPVIFWNVTHDWISAKHILQISGTQKMTISIGHLAEFIGGQMLVISPLLFLGYLMTIFYLSYKGIKEKAIHWIFLFCSSVPYLAFFFLLSLRKPAYANWTAPAYVTGFIALASLIHSNFKRAKSRGAKNCLWAGGFISLALGIFLALMAFNPQIIRSMGIKLPPEADLTNNLYGWRQLGAKVKEVLKVMPPGTFLFSCRYQTASELAFYTQRPYETFCLFLKGRWNQFLYWDDLKSRIGSPAIYVAETKDDRDIVKYLPFKAIQSEKPLKIYRQPLYNVPIKTFYIYRCYHFKGIRAPLEPLEY